MRGRNTPALREPFLAALAESSNISAAARKAKVPTSTTYKLRREDAGFRSAWFDALCKGYDNLEMSLLDRLRIGELEGTKAKARRKFDNATAFRLLAAYREAVSQQKAIREDEDAMLASINTKLDAVLARPAPGPNGSATSPNATGTRGSLWSGRRYPKSGPSW